MVDIRIKRIYEPATADDGTRVLVDRIWPRGVSKGEADLALWLKEVAPSAALRKWFGHDPARWKEFRARYDRELDGNGAAVDRLRELVRAGRVTLLYGARDTEHNQAVALAAYMQEKERKRS